jgi:hypothetical protein
MWGRAARDSDRQVPCLPSPGPLVDAIGATGRARFDSYRGRASATDP